MHVQDADSQLNVPYLVEIPNQYLDAVFDVDIGQGESWSDFLRDEVADLGSAMLDGYFLKMAQISGKVREKCSWVIATLDKVIERDQAVELHGRALPFDRERLFGISPPAGI